MRKVIRDQRVSKVQWGLMVLLVLLVLRVLRVPLVLRV